jgi:hypothetical protein
MTGGYSPSDWIALLAPRTPTAAISDVDAVTEAKMADAITSFANMLLISFSDFRLI